MKKVENYLNDLFKFRIKDTDKDIYYLTLFFIITLSIIRLISELTNFYPMLKSFPIAPYHVYYLFFIPFLYYVIDGIKKKKIKLNLPNIFMILYLLFCLISTILSETKYYAIFGNYGRREGLISILVYFMIYLNISIMNKNDIKRLLKIFCYLIFFTTVFGLYQSYFPTLSRNYQMACGLAGNPNFFGSFNCMFSTLFLGLYLFYEKDKLYLITSISSYIGLLLSDSTGPFLSFCLGLIIIIIYQIIKKHKLNSIIIIISIFVGLFPIIQLSMAKFNKDSIYFIEAPAIYKDIIYLCDKYAHITDYLNNIKSNQISNDVVNNTIEANTITESVLTRSVSSGRMFIWTEGYKLFLEHPLFGTGLETFRVYTPNMESLADKAHNNYLEIAVCTGIFSLISYLGYLISLTINAIKTKNKIILPFIFAFIVYNIQIGMNISTILVAPYFYMIAGILLNLINNKNMKKL